MLYFGKVEFCTEGAKICLLKGLRVNQGFHRLDPVQQSDYTLPVISQAQHQFDPVQL